MTVDRAKVIDERGSTPVRIGDFDCNRLPLVLFAIDSAVSYGFDPPIKIENTTCTGFFNLRSSIIRDLRIRTVTINAIGHRIKSR